jgi:hypothetical protein
MVTDPPMSIFQYSVSSSSSPWTGRDGTVLRPILVPVFSPRRYCIVRSSSFLLSLFLSRSHRRNAARNHHTEKQTPRGRFLLNATMEIAAERQAVLDSSSYHGTIARSGDSKNDDDDEGLENCRCTGSPEEISPPRGEVSRVGR